MGHKFCPHCAIPSREVHQLTASALTCQKVGGIPHQPLANLGKLSKLCDQGGSRFHVLLLGESKMRKIMMTIAGSTVLCGTALIASANELAPPAQAPMQAPQAKQAPMQAPMQAPQAKQAPMQAPTPKQAPMQAPAPQQKLAPMQAPAQAPQNKMAQAPMQSP